MCVIIATPDRKHRPTLETLRACERANPHGCGMAWVQHGKAHWMKGLSAEGVSELLDILDGPVVIHFRWATVGGMKLSLVHPFEISPASPLRQYGQVDTLLFHNGHWDGWERFAKEHKLNLAGPVSDSRIIAAGVDKIGSKLLRTIPGRFVLFTKSGFELFGDWSNEAGCQFSNLNWVSRRKIAPVPEYTPPPEKRVKQYELEPRNARATREAMACYAD